MRSPRPTILALAAAGLVVAARPARAAGGGGATGESLVIVLLLLVVLAAAYLLTHFVVNRLQQRFLLVTGIEYVVLGALLWPALGDVDPATKLAPAVAFAVGWIGLLRGTEQSIELLQKSPRFSLRLAALELVLTFSLVTAGSLLLLSQLVDAPERELLTVAATLGIAGVAGSTSAAEVVSARYRHLADGLLPVLRRAARYTELAAILGWGVLLAVFHDLPLDAPVILGPSDWVLVTLGLGVGLGWLFSAFMGEERDEHVRFLAMVGIISLATGAALFLDLSGMAVNLVLGILLANTAQGAGLHDTLVRTQKPLVLMMLVLAGVLWRPVPLVDGLLVTGAVVGLRLVGRLLGGWLASSGTPLRGDLGRGTLSQGEVALAIALSLRLVLEASPLVDLAFTAILGSVLIFELAAPRMLKSLLVDAGELRQDHDLGGGQGASAGEQAG